jgi:hypothetical protein
MQWYSALYGCAAPVILIYPLPLSFFLPTSHVAWGIGEALEILFSILALYRAIFYKNVGMQKVLPK